MTNQLLRFAVETCDSGHNLSRYRYERHLALLKLDGFYVSVIQIKSRSKSCVTERLLFIGLFS